VALTTFLFDLDGTLIDSIELIIRSYQHTIRTHRRQETAPEVWMKGLGIPLRVQFKEWSEDPTEIDAMVATYREYNLSHHDEMVTAYDGVVDAVKRLRRQGKQLGLVTSKFRSGAYRGLKKVGLDQDFHIVVGADEVANPKPHPEPVLTALSRLSARPEEAVFIGDSRHDMECGRAAGVRTAAVLWGPFGRSDLEDLRPDYWLETPSELERLTSDV